MVLALDGTEEVVGKPIVEVMVEPTGSTTLFLLITAGRLVGGGEAGPGGGDEQSNRGLPLTTKLSVSVVVLCMEGAEFGIPSFVLVVGTTTFSKESNFEVL